MDSFVCFLKQTEQKIRIFLFPRLTHFQRHKAEWLGTFYLNMELILWNRKHAFVLLKFTNMLWNV